MEKAPTRALTPRSLNVKLGLRSNYHKGRAAIRHYALERQRIATTITKLGPGIEASLGKYFGTSAE